MDNNKVFLNNSYPPQRRQRGVIAVIVAVGIAALIGVVGLALDTGHMLLNKTRLQNAVDAGALSGARALQESTSITPLDDARAAAIASFNTNLSIELSGQAPVPTVTFSEDLTPGSFVATPVNPPNYIKVTTPAVSLTSFLIRAVGFDDKKVAAISVAGFGNGAAVCDMIPVMVCGEPDTNPNDNEIFGYKEFNPNSFNEAEDTITLKFGSGDGPDTEVGTGSFHLIDLPGLQGANDIRYAFAGSSSCGTQSASTEVDLAPGNKVGPVVQGINTRFGLYAGPLNGTETTYPADYTNNGQLTDCGSGPTACLNPVNYYQAYADNSSWSQGSLGTPDPYHRRVVTVPIGDCSGSATGNDVLPTLGFGCFLLTAPAVQTGGTEEGELGSGSLQGVFIEECTPPAEGVTENSGVITIFLYKNPDGADS